MSGGRADCGRFRKEKSKSGRLWGVSETVRKKMNGVGGKRTADRSAEKRAIMGGHQVGRKEGRRKMNGVRGESGLRTDSQRKEQK